MAPRLVSPGGRVCIVGGGTSGLVAAKACLDGGLVPTVFEKTENVGGVWRLDDEPTRVAYESLYTNSSGGLMCISDFPMDPELHARFPGRRDICNYYEAYMQHFGLRKHVQLGVEVVSVRREGTHWRVVVSRQDVEEELSFEAVFLCTGQFRDPIRPSLPGAASFQGRITHSAEYREPGPLVGKKVVVVGNGNSALDISLEAARAGAASVTVVCRSFTNVIPVADYYGRPVDQMINTRLFNAVPSVLRSLMFLRLVHGTNAYFSKQGMPAAPSAVNEDVGFSNLKEHVTYRRFIKEGRIQLLPGAIREVGQNGVILSTGEEIPADELILCTGYELQFPFLAPELSNDFLVTTAGRKHMNAYKLVMHPSHPTLCALGFLLTFGNESCVAEMQARWSVAHWVGRTSLPSEKALEVDLKRRRKGKKYPQFVPYVAYMDELAADSGVAPSLTAGMLLSSPRLFWKLLVGPVVPAQYRLVGEQSWAGAADFIKSQPAVVQRWFHLAWAPPHSKSASDAPLQSKL